MKQPVVRPLYAIYQNFNSENRYNCEMEYYDNYSSFYFNIFLFLLRDIFLFQLSPLDYTELS